MKKRRFIAFVVGVSLSFSLIFIPKIFQQNHSKTTPSNSPALTKVVRIGHQPHGTFLYLKISHNLEKRLSRLGYSVEWTEFAAGPPILAALGEGKIDMGYAGVVPAIFAQANDIPLVYIGYDPSLPDSIGILVRQNSPIQTLADLKGKKITAPAKTASHYLLIRALLKADLSLNDVNFVDLPPLQGQEAFKQGKVDAWIGWHPFLGELQDTMPVRLLTNSQGLMNDKNFYLASRSFAENQSQLIRIIMEESRQVGQWATEQPEAAAEVLSSNAKIEPNIALKLTKARRFEALPMEYRAVEEQQRIAETFYRLGFLPKRIWVEDAVWKQTLNNWGE
ncbi:aliphatic sulfonate ABC transporter substrate-binding protein [Ancylothrix sp. C2]|uniref:aliphatic sulfonate ABC transporter substrate-binding protein n=1 Tax=Ancylothrix sp. D3o TaxID=2953691 RepID=UPI0021BB183F|nr:aliphatic sulfonate ABC transporter substrate-binding protein [Ancylothrix sp. D3o]MCT7951754.1 aliphatic sulfonate ABC transporter substrate-binding protein [Ancylothrix sp. D3o]